MSGPVGNERTHEFNGLTVAGGFRILDLATGNKADFDFGDAAHHRRRSVQMAAQGLSGENYQHENTSNTTALVSGRVYYMLMPWLAGEVVTNLWFANGTALNTPTLTRAGIYSQAGPALLAQTGDLSGTFAATGNFACPLTTPLRITADAAYWAAIIFTGTTGPALCRTGNIQANCNVFGSNPGSSAFQSGQTDLPSTGSISYGTTALCFWVGWS